MGAGSVVKRIYGIGRDRYYVSGPRHPSFLKIFYRLT